MIHNARFVYTYLRERNWNSRSIHALLGNMHGESAINPGRREGGTGRGWGLIQWTPDTRYLNWAAPRGFRNDCMIGQLERILYEVPITNSTQSNEYGFQWLSNQYRARAAGYANPRIPFDTYVQFTTNTNNRSLEVLTGMFVIYRLAPGWVLTAGGWRLYLNPGQPVPPAHIATMQTQLNRRIGYSQNWSTHVYGW